MLLDSRAYGTTRPLVERFLTAFFEYMWAVDSKRPQEQQRLIYSVLQHEHNERAVLEVSSFGCADSFVPLVPSITAEEQFFVHHVVRAAD